MDKVKEGTFFNFKGLNNKHFIIKKILAGKIFYEKINSHKDENIYSIEEYAFEQIFDKIN